MIEKVEKVNLAPWICLHNAKNLGKEVNPVHRHHLNQTYSPPEMDVLVVSLNSSKSVLVPPTLSIAGFSPLAMLMTRGAVKLIAALQLLLIWLAPIVTDRNSGSTSYSTPSISRKRSTGSDVGLKTWP